MVDPIGVNATLSAGSHGWSFAKAFLGETNSSMVKSFEDKSKENGVFGAVPGPISVDSPALRCLYHTFVGPSDKCPPGNYVFYTKKNMGKSSALRIFCQKTLKKANRRSIYVSGMGATRTYFENVAGNLSVENYESNWPKCLVAAMARARGPGPNEPPPVLVLDEFNDLGDKNENLPAMDSFMRQCLNRDMYLIVVTSRENIADELVYLNGWGKIVPLQAVHEGSVFEGREETEKPSWKALTWSTEQLKKVVSKHVKGDLGEYEFLREGMTPLGAIRAAKLDVMQKSGETLGDVSDEEM